MLQRLVYRAPVVESATVQAVLDAGDELTVLATRGSQLASYVAPSRGSDQLCAWKLTVPATMRGVAHRPTREEVIVACR